MRLAAVFGLIAVLATGAVSEALAQGMMDRHQHRPGHRHMVRHMFVMMNGIPESYMELANPLPADAATVARGGRLYGEHCLLCHGFGGRGDGEEADKLEPRPADLTHTLSMPIGSDPFLFWTLDVGGAPVQSGMPAYGEVLSEEDRWAVIRYLRAGFPAVE